MDETSNNWIMDSEATKHMTKDGGGFCEFRSIDVSTSKIYMGINSSKNVLGTGDYFLPTSTEKTLVLHETLYVLGLRQNLLSVYRLTRDGFDFCFSKDRISIIKNNLIYAWGTVFGDLFNLDSINFMSDCSSSFMVNDTSFESVKWHARLGHIGRDLMI